MVIDAATDTKLRIEEVDFMKIKKKQLFKAQYSPRALTPFT